MDAALRFPGITNAWTMPIKNRIDMLTTGDPHADRDQDLRRPTSPRSSGSARGSRRSCATCRARAASSPSASAGGYFVDFDLRRDALARYGLSVEDAQDDRDRRRSAARTSPPRSRAASAIPVNVRYPRELRDDLDAARARAGADAVGRAGPARRRWPSIRMATGPVDDPQRERPARRLRLRGHRRDATSAATSSEAKARGGARGSPLPPGYIARVERTVREHAARARAAEARRAAHALPDLLPALPEHEVGREDRASCCWRCRSR